MVHLVAVLERMSFRLIFLDGDFVIPSQQWTFTLVYLRFFLLLMLFPIVANEFPTSVTTASLMLTVTTANIVHPKISWEFK